MKYVDAVLNSRRFCGQLGMAAFAACLIGSIPANAGMIVTIPSVSALIGTTGNSLDVLVQRSGADVTVAGFQFQITSASSFINFTLVNISTVADPYIFAGNSLFGPNINTMTGQTIDGSDLPAAGAGTLMHNGNIFALGHVLFNVSPSATPGPVSVTFKTGTSQTSFSDPTGAAIPIDQFNGGTITITSSSTIPEPATWGLMGTALLGLGTLVVRRRR